MPRPLVSTIGACGDAGWGTAGFRSGSGRSRSWRTAAVWSGESVMLESVRASARTASAAASTFAFSSSASPARAESRAGRSSAGSGGVAAISLYPERSWSPRRSGKTAVPGIRASSHAGGEHNPRIGRQLVRDAGQPVGDRAALLPAFVEPVKQNDDITGGDNLVSRPGTSLTAAATGPCGLVIRRVTSAGIRRVHDKYITSPRQVHDRLNQIQSLTGDTGNPLAA